jgi:hypothetical protein
VSEKTADDLRKILEARPLDASAADYFLEHSPRCECELASAVSGGHGAVERQEKLSIFLGSPRHSRERYKDKETADKAGFPYKTNVFDAAFRGGLSLMREDKATNDEVRRQGAKIAEGLRSDNPKNGFYSVLQFDAEVIFSATDTKVGSRNFCLYDTPIDTDIEGQEVYSHADIFAGGEPPVSALRTARRLQIRQAVAANYDELTVGEYREGILNDWIAESAFEKEKEKAKAEEEAEEGKSA